MAFKFNPFTGNFDEVPDPEITVSTANETLSGPTSPTDLTDILWSTALGNNALGTPTGKTYGNTAIGDNALASVTQDPKVSGSGSFNTGVGRNAGGLITTGYSNTCVGDEGAPSLTTGFDNTYLGRSAGLLAVDGDYNTGVGRSALYNNNSGTDNTAIGRSAGLANTSGSYNTFLGRNAGSSSTATISKSTLIGYNAQTTLSSVMILGGTGVDAVKVGIGTSAPTCVLDVTTQTATTITSASGSETIAPLSANYTAVKFNTGSSTTIGNVIFKLSRDATITELSYLGLRLYTNNAGKPGTMVAYAQNNGGLAFTTSSASVGFRLNATVTASTDYWLIFFKGVTSPDTGNFNAYSVAESGGITWGTCSTITGTYSMQTGSLAVIIQAAQAGATKITGGPGNTALTIASPDADAVSITTTSGLALSATSTNNTAINAVSTNGLSIYAYSGTGAGASFNTGRGIALAANQSGWNATGTIAQPVISIYRFYNSSTNLTGDLLKINDASTTSGTNSGNLINAGLTPASTFIPKFQVDRNGNTTANTFISTQATGSAPLTVASTTEVTNLNADLLDGQHGAYYATAAGYVPYAGATTSVDLGYQALSSGVHTVNRELDADRIVNGAFTTNLDNWDSASWEWNALGAYCESTGEAISQTMSGAGGRAYFTFKAQTEEEDSCLIKVTISSGTYSDDYYFSTYGTGALESFSTSIVNYFNSTITFEPVSGAFGGIYLKDVSIKPYSYPYTSSQIYGDQKVLGSVEASAFWAKRGDVLHIINPSTTATSAVTLTLPATSGTLATVQLKQIVFCISGSAGAKARTRVAVAGTIMGAYITGDVSGSCVVDVWKANNAVPTVTNTITASAKPTLSSAQYASDTTLTGWTKTIAAGDWLVASVDSASTLTDIVLVLTVL